MSSDSEEVDTQLETQILSPLKRDDDNSKTEEDLVTPFSTSRPSQAQNSDDEIDTQAPTQEVQGSSPVRSDSEAVTSIADSGNEDDDAQVSKAKRSRFAESSSEDEEDLTKKSVERKKRLMRRSSSSSSNSSDSDASKQASRNAERGGGRRREHSGSEDSDREDGEADEAKRPSTSKERDEKREESDPEDEGKSGMLDFDLMMEKKRATNRRYRKRKDIDVINDNDDAIAKLIADMRQAARDDRELNERQLPATKKLGMLPVVMESIAKIDLQMAFIEANILAVMTDWLAPLPFDKSLPNIRIRSEFLRFLHEIPIDDLSRLKESGIGKAVMYLYRHPKETRQNKDLSGAIINKWARPIFKVRTDFSTMSKRDREERDLEMAEKLKLKRGRRTGLAAAKSAKKQEEQEALKPGDPGWVNRARVPMVDNREYVKRPNWQSHEDVAEDKAKKEITLLEKHKRKFADRKKLAKMQHAVKISLEGKNMKL